MRLHRPDACPTAPPLSLRPSTPSLPLHNLSALIPRDPARADRDHRATRNHARRVLVHPRVRRPEGVRDGQREEAREDEVETRLSDRLGVGEAAWGGHTRVVTAISAAGRWLRLGTTSTPGCQWKTFSCSPTTITGFRVPSA